MSEILDAYLGGLNLLYWFRGTVHLAGSFLIQYILCAGFVNPAHRMCGVVNRD